VSRLWSRFGVRALSIALLAVAVVGGVYLGKDREAQQRGIDASAAVQAEAVEEQLLKEYVAAKMAATAEQRAARREAERKARAAARAAAERAKRADEAASRKKSEKTEPTGPTRTPAFPGPIPASCNEFSGNRRTGCALMIQRGFPISQFTCLNRLWNRESGWNHRARNPGSGAYGIPQAVPGDKMGSSGSDWRTNPATQIKWGLGYIKGRYKTPCRAWQHSEDVGWY
jgi:hypothetical protein